MGDRGLLTALFQNLIGNAIKFRSDLPPVTSRSPRRRRTDEFVLSVEDNGIGIDDRVRRPDLRDLPAAARAGGYPGTGIGLAMCQQDRRVPRRTDLARLGVLAGESVLLHSSGSREGDPQ